MNIRWPILCLALVSFDSLACDRPLKAGLLEEGALFNSTTGVGIDKDVVAEVSRRLDCPIQTSSEPRVRQWRALADGQLDIMTGARTTPEREKFAAFMPYLKGSPVTVARTGISRLSASEFIVNRSLRLGIVRGYSYGPRLDQVIGELHAGGDRIVEVSTADQLIGLLRTGRIDAFLSLPTVMGQWRDIEQIARQIDWVPQETPTVGGFAVSRATVSPEDHAAIAKALLDIQADGTLRAILYRYLPPEIADLLLITPPAN